MPTVVQDVSGDSALQTAIASLKAKIEAAEESSDIAQLVSDINTALAGKQNTLTFDNTPTAGSSNPVTSGGIKTALDAANDEIGELKENLSDLQELADTKAAAIYETASGEIASFSDGADDLPMKSCVVKIEPIQIGSGDPSPENVRPISGRTGTKVTRTGKNVLPCMWELGTIGTYEEQFVLVNGSDRYRQIGISVPAGTYTASVSGGITKYVLYKYDKDTKVTRIIKIMTETGNSVTFTIAENELIAIALDKAEIADITAVPVQLEAGSTATDYEPYKGTEVSVNWESEAGTVYGGTLDIVSGKLVATHAKIKVSNRTWTKDSSYDRLICGISDMIANKYTARTVPLKSSMALTITDGRGLASVPNNCFYGAGGASRSVFFQTTDYTTPEAFLAVYGDSDLVYELAEPIEIQLTPQEICTLLGENNIWSDSEDVTVEYPADTKIYIDTKIAEAVAAAMA